jgi:hypothetical protein
MVATLYTQKVRRATVLSQRSASRPRDRSGNDERSLVDREGRRNSLQRRLSDRERDRLERGKCRHLAASPPSATASQPKPKSILVWIRRSMGRNHETGQGLVSAFRILETWRALFGSAARANQVNRHGRSAKRISLLAVRIDKAAVARDETNRYTPDDLIPQRGLSPAQ